MNMDVFLFYVTNFAYNILGHQSVIWEKESDDSTAKDESDTEDKTTIKPTQENKKSWIQKKLPKRTKDEWINVVKDSLIFYSTAFSVLLSILSITAMMFLVPFFIDPAWSTLQADFDVNGTNCNTTTGFERKGIENICLDLVKKFQFIYNIFD